MLSIVIPVYNQWEMTCECLEAIPANTTDYEIILVDNGSTVPIYGETFTVIRNETNLGFPAAVNQSIRAAKGDTIILLNNDVIVTPNWATRIQHHLKSYDIIGPVTNYAAGIQRVGLPAYMDDNELACEAEKWSKDHAEESQEVVWVIGFCMAFKKSLWEELGPFDESLWPCSGEEIDFCHRARARGYRVGIARDVYVHHHGTVTFKQMEKAGILNYEETCNRNNDYLEDRWGPSWFIQTVAPQDAPGSTISGGLRLNLGCGYAIIEDYVNIDNRPEVKPDLICDILDGLPYDDNSVDEVRAHDFLEHIPLGKTHQVIEEIWRVLKPGGLFDSLTPDAEKGQGAFQDPFHLSFWVEQSWLYYSDPNCRLLYGTKANFKIQSITKGESNFRVYHLRVLAIADKKNALPVEIQVNKPLDQQKEVRLNMGCGRHKLDGFINVDLLPNTSPDLLADALNLHYSSGTVDEIYAGHILEHLTGDEGKAALKYWYSLLKPGGIIGVTVPNFDFLAANYLGDPAPDLMRELNDCFLYSYVQDSPHKYCYGPSLLEEVMKEAGFIDLERLPENFKYYESQAPWQVGYRGQKEE